MSGGINWLVLSGFLVLAGTLPATAGGQSRPDLIATTITSPALVRPGDAIPVDITVRSGDRSVSGGWMWAVMASRDSTFSTDDVALGGGQYTSNLGSNGSATFRATVTIPPNVSLGAYRLLIVVDPTNMLTEAREDNNMAGASAPTVIDLPDLIPEQLAASHSQVSPGQAITVSVRGRNIGGNTAPAGWVGSLVLSRDTIVSADDVRLTSFVEGTTLAPSTSGSVRTLSVTIPSNAPTGTHHLLATTDSGRVVKERRVDNNVGRWPLAISPLVIPGVNNETGSAAEVDYCAFNPTTINGTSADVIPVYTQVFENGVTNLAGASATIGVSVGWGPAGSDPRTSSAWTWRSATYVRDVTGGNDEYSGATAATSGTYALATRVTQDGGQTHTYCDTNGAGSQAGADFSAAALGTLTISPGSAPDLVVSTVDVAAHATATDSMVITFTFSNTSPVSVLGTSTITFSACVSYDGVVPVIPTCQLGAGGQLRLPIAAGAVIRTSETFARACETQDVFFIVKIDAAQAVPESSEVNNTRVSPPFLRRTSGC